MNRRIVKAILVFIVVLIFSHAYVWFLNDEIHQARKKEYDDMILTIPESIRSIRAKLEAKQLRELHSYKKLDGERSGYVEIPIDRAFDYYLQRANSK
jgi:uncharacterized membrane protein YhiD involved in acid resistance